MGSPTSLDVPRMVRSGRVVRQPEIGGERRTHKGVAKDKGGCWARWQQKRAGEGRTDLDVANHLNFAGGNLQKRNSAQSDHVRPATSRLTHSISGPQHKPTPSQPPKPKKFIVHLPAHPTALPPLPALGCPNVGIPVDAS